MAKRENYCYYAPVLKKKNSEWYKEQVQRAKNLIGEVTEKIYNDEFPTDRNCSKRIHAFTGCTPIYIADKEKELHLAQIREVIEQVFVAGRMFEVAQQRSLENNK